jgi:hypothetical protein
MNPPFILVSPSVDMSDWEVGYVWARGQTCPVISDLEGLDNFGRTCPTKGAGWICPVKFG